MRQAAALSMTSTPMPRRHQRAQQGRLRESAGGCRCRAAGHHIPVAQVVSKSASVSASNASGPQSVSRRCGVSSRLLVVAHAVDRDIAWPVGGDDVLADRAVGLKFHAVAVWRVR